MPSILYCEDDQGVNKIFSLWFNNRFPDYTLVPTISVGEALGAARPIIGGISLVLTDGYLGYQSGKDEYGWDLAAKLRKMGYQGPIAYIGGTDIPEGKSVLFTDIVGKYFLKVKEYLENALK